MFFNNHVVLSLPKCTKFLVIIILIITCYCIYVINFSNISPVSDEWVFVIFTVTGIRLEFVKPIKDVTVKERETAEFSVELSHDKIPLVWYKNDVRLHPSKVVHMSDQGKIHTLAFKEVTIDDTSMIKVEAMDKAVTAMLTVIGQYHFERIFSRLSRTDPAWLHVLHQTTNKIKYKV